MELKLLTQWSECARAESGCFRILKECLVFSSMRLGVPFIAPRQLGAVGHNLGRQFLPSVEWCTGQSCAPSDNHCLCPMLDFFPYGEQPTVGPQDRLAHRTLSGAHRTVRCAQPTVGATTCRAKIARPTVDSPDSPVHHQTVRWIIAMSPWTFSRERRVRRGWLTGQSGAPPDSPVNYSRTPPSTPESGLFTGDQSGASNTDRCTTGQSSVPDRAEVWPHRAKSFRFLFSFFCHCL
jgi:hypothetical protein